jgi:DHA1 family multidrug resistance protein-like MFS transporter
VEEGHWYGQGSMMGVFNMAMSVGVLIGSLLAGSFMDLLGLKYVFYIISVILVVSAVAGGIMIAWGGAREEDAPTISGSD